MTDHKHNYGNRRTAADRARAVHQGTNQKFAEAMRQLTDDPSDDPSDVPDADDSSVTRDEVMR